MPKIVEATSCRMGVQLALSFNFPNVIFESDCLGLIQKINSRQSDLSALGLLVADIQVLMRSFVSCSFTYQPCSCDMGHAKGDVPATATTSVFLTIEFNYWKKNNHWKIFIVNVFLTNIGEK